jgi:heat shock protein HslJ
MRNSLLNISLLSSLFALGFATSCKSDDDRSAVEAQVINRDFVLEDATGYEPVANTVIRVKFSDSELSFSAGCNLYSAAYEIENNVIVVKEMGSTDMGCNAEYATQDEWLSKFFESKPTLTVSGDKLSISSDDATLTFLDREVAEPDQALLGTLWTIDTLVEGEAASSIVSTLEKPAVTFDKKGRVVIETGCNTGAGTFAATDNELTFNDVSFTKSTCTTSEATALVEHLEDVFSDGTANYSIEAARLSIERGDIGIGAIAKDE